MNYLIFGRRRRWSDVDSHFGPFTLSRSSIRDLWELKLDSGDENYPGCTLRVRGLGYVVVMEMPPVLPPHRRRVDANWDEATVRRLGRNWYEVVSQRSVGLSLSEGRFLSLDYGAQENDGKGRNSWTCSLPWGVWEVVRKTFYNRDGAPVFTATQEEKFAGWPSTHSDFPNVCFEFEDYDGKKIVASTHIEELEWRRGRGWFRWVSWFVKPKIRRTLDIWFSEETGKEKGSWKGGTLGCGIEMLPGESHADAFRRYCDQNKMTFLGAQTPVWE